MKNYDILFCIDSTQFPYSFCFIINDYYLSLCIESIYFNWNGFFSYLTKTTVGKKHAKAHKKKKLSHHVTDSTKSAQKQKQNPMYNSWERLDSGENVVKIGRH